jgi:predicted Rossmann fold flavoprotein
MLFTHFGISGPLVLSGSRALLDYGFTGCVARIDLKPGLSDDKLRARVARDLQLYSKKSLKNAMVDLLPARLIPAVIVCAGLSPETRADTVGKAGTARLSEALKGVRLTIKAPRPASEAIVTAGGVKTSQINPATMESKRTPGLFFCGELIDVDAFTGGFNLSIAFATGHAAGIGAVSGL